MAKNCYGYIVEGFILNGFWLYTLAGYLSGIKKGSEAALFVM
jgi:hypothetical protein